jgi:hypothetical protein
LETQINATETLAGLMILLRLVTYVLGITAAFALVRYHILSVRAVVCLSAIASALTLIAFGTNMTTTAQTGSFITLSLVFGLFFSMLSQPVPALVLGALGLEDLAHGLAIYKLSPSIGSMIGTGMFQTLLDHRSTLHITELGAAITRARLPIEQFIDHGGKADGLTRLVAVQAQSLAFQDAMIAFAAFTLLTIPIVLFADSGPAPKR